jgi:hypothetical protein
MVRFFLTRHFGRTRRLLRRAKNVRNGPNHEISPVFHALIRTWASFRNCSG